MAATRSPSEGAAPGGVTARRLVLVGGGDHARVILDAAMARSEDWSVEGFTDPDPEAAGRAGIGLAHLGDDAAASGRFAAMPPDRRPWLILGIGGPPELRRRAAAAFGTELNWATLIHPAATVSPSAAVLEGTVVLAGAIVNAGARLGRHVIVNSGAVVEHDVVLGDHVAVAPGAIIGGGARIGEDSVIALGAMVRDHVTVGRDVVVGMGAVVVDDVPSGTTVVGSPARPIESRR